MEKDKIKSKVKEGFDNIKDMVSDEDKSDKKIEPIIVSRVLFISALDKIYLVLLFVLLIGGTYNIFVGDISSISYGFWSRLCSELVLLVVLFILYLFLNWFYKCANKTILCLTNNQVYKEEYIPFKRKEYSIPISHITKVSTVNWFWIFRSIVIHQYGRLPMIFFTWNNSEFKSELDKLIIKEKNKVKNEYEDVNILNKGQFKYLIYVGAVLGLIVLLVGVVRLFCYIFNEESKLSGTYVKDEASIVLNSDGSCEINDVFSRNVGKCNWEFDKKNDKVVLNYEYSSSYWDNTYEMELVYNSGSKSLKYDDAVFLKK